MNKIRYYRNLKGFTLQCIANSSGISVSYLCHLEKGSRNNPSFRVMQRIALALNEDIYKIF